MSVLRNRIVAKYQDAPGVQSGPAYTHPYGTRATQMEMPLALVDYQGTGARYQDLHSIPATADPNHVPFGVVAPGSFGKVVRAGVA